jgi:hypothetical protein
MSGIDLSVKETRHLLGETHAPREFTILEKFGNKWLDYGMKFPQTFLTSYQSQLMPESMQRKMEFKADFMQCSTISTLWYLQQHGSIRNLNTAIRSLFKQAWMQQDEIDDLLQWYYLFVIDKMEEDMIALEYYEVMARFKSLKSKVYDEPGLLS